MYVRAISLTIQRKIKGISPEPVSNIVIKLLQEPLHKERKLKLANQLSLWEGLLFGWVDEMIKRMLEDGVGILVECVEVKLWVLLFIGTLCNWRTKLHRFVK